MVFKGRHCATTRFGRTLESWGVLLPRQSYKVFAGDLHLPEAAEKGSLGLWDTPAAFSSQIYPLEAGLAVAFDLCSLAYMLFTNFATKIHFFIRRHVSCMT